MRMTIAQLGNSFYTLRNWSVAVVADKIPASVTAPISGVWTLPGIFAKVRLRVSIEHLLTVLTVVFVFEKREKISHSNHLCGC